MANNLPDTCLYCINRGPFIPESKVEIRIFVQLFVLIILRLPILKANTVIEVCLITQLQWLKIPITWLNSHDCNVYYSNDRIPKGLRWPLR